MEDIQRQNHRNRGRPLNRGNPSRANVQNANLISDKLKTLYTNVDNSLLSKIDELKARISLENPDLICLCEIKPKNGQLPSKEVLEIEGYDLQLSPSYQSETTRGVCIYTKHNLNAIHISNETTFDDSVFITIPGKRN